MSDLGVLFEACDRCQWHEVCEWCSLGTLVSIHYLPIIIADIKCHSLVTPVNLFFLPVDHQKCCALIQIVFASGFKYWDILAVMIIGILIIITFSAILRLSLD